LSELRIFMAGRLPRSIKIGLLEGS